MILLDTTYFIRDLHIPNLLVKSNRKGDHMSKALHETLNTSIEEFLDEYEYEFLVKLLGKEFADYFIEHKDEFAALKPLLLDEKRKLSPIANYVYVMWATNNQSQTTLSGGEIVGKTDYSSSVSEPIKQRRAWNKMVDMVYIISAHLYHNRSLYLDYLGDESGRDIGGLTRTWNFLGL